MQVDWELSQQFVSDSQGIRDVCIVPGSNNEVDSLTLMTGNQGGGLCGFGTPSGSIFPVEYQHNHAVTALISDSEHYITGCKDAMIRVFDVKTNAVVATLTGHEKPVTSLSFVSNGENQKFLVSGSWDGTAKVWDIGRKAMIATLPDHENSVCVTGLQSEDGPSSSSIVKIATGSAGAASNNQISGHSVRIWTVDVKTGQVTCQNTVSNDHQGPIRDIALLPGGHIVTCSNDGTAKLRTSDTGDCLSTLVFLQQNHPPMLLSVSPVGDGGVAAGAEDGNVVVWNLDGEGGDPQIILHPQCVWNVFGLPNGDLVTCCQDGTLRIFTKATDRMAPIQEREEFATKVQEAHKKKSSGPSAEEVAKLPLWEQNLQKRGTSEGQVQLFNKGGIAIAAQWSATSQTWIEVGQVMGSNDGGTIDGVSYDHVLPIEVDQTGGGVAKLQIGYNNGENPFVAAQRFIDAYQLPQYHLSDIADYIQQRVGNEGTTLGGGGSSGGPSASAAVAPVATTGIPMISYDHLPMSGYKSFELSAKNATTTLEKMKTKITEVGKLSDTQLTSLASLIETLGATNRYHATKISTDELAVITSMIDTFPSSEVFPALDLARLTVCHPDAASATNSKLWSTAISKAVALCGGEDPVTGVAIPMLSLRLFANAFRGGPGSREAVTGALDGIMSCAVKFVPSKNKNVRLSVATVIYNISYYLHSSPPARPDIAQELVGCVNSILKARSYEGEAITRTLVALGTAALASKEAKEAAKTIHVVSMVEMSASPHGDIARAVAKEVYNVLQ